MIQFNAHFDGKHLSPDEPISLPTGTPLRVTVVPIVERSKDENGQSPLDVFGDLESEVGLMDGPSDWSERHDHYLFGAVDDSNDGDE